MDSTVNQLVFLIKQLVDAEKEYMIDYGFFLELQKGDIFGSRLIYYRQKLLDTIQFVRYEYKNLNLSNSNSEMKFYQLLMCKKFETIKQIILFEDSVLIKINEEIHNFYKKVNKIFYKPYDEDFVNSEETVVTSSNNNKSKRLNYPNKVVRVLKGWLERNILDPYPSEDQKEEFCEKTGLEMNQINNWFINARRRILPQLKRNYEKFM